MAIIKVVFFLKPWEHSMGVSREITQAVRLTSALSSSQGCPSLFVCPVTSDTLLSILTAQKQPMLV